MVVNSVTHVLINNIKLTLTAENEQLTIFLDENKKSFMINIEFQDKLVLIKIDNIKKRFKTKKITKLMHKKK